MLESRQNHSITSESLPVIESLNRLAANSNMLDLIRNALSKARASLKFDPLLKVAVEVLDPAIIRQIVPEIGSARLVAIRDGFDSGIESHPNSTQYLFSLEGSGETHVKTSDGWRIDNYGIGSRIEDRFHVVFPGVWHKSTAAHGDWVVIAFHTAEKVIDDYDFVE